MGLAAARARCGDETRSRIPTNAALLHIIDHELAIDEIRELPKTDPVFRLPP